jgi:hypothetical protein
MIEAKSSCGLKGIIREVFMGLPIRKNGQGKHYSWMGFPTIVLLFSLTACGLETSGNIPNNTNTPAEEPDAQIGYGGPRMVGATGRSIPTAKIVFPTKNPIVDSTTIIPRSTKYPATPTLMRSPEPTLVPTPTNGPSPKTSPEQKENCPSLSNEAAKIKFELETSDYAVDFLHYVQSNGISSGTVSQLLDRVHQMVMPSPESVGLGVGAGSANHLPPPHVAIRMDDITGNGTPEMVVLINNNIQPGPTQDDGAIFIIGCRSGKFQIVLQKLMRGSPIEMEEQDVNNDGFMEWVVLFGAIDDFHEYNGQMVLGWNGNTITDLLNGSHAEEAVDYFSTSTDQHRLDVRDIDGNGTQEILAWSHQYCHGGDAGDCGAFREAFDIFMWLDGEYRKLRTEYDPPQYRFQAVLDGDNYTYYGLYEKAIDMYRRAVLDDALKSANLADMHKDGQFRGVSDHAPGQNEPESMRAYATFRWLVNELKIGHPGISADLLSAIRTNYPSGTSGYPYREMAETFWTEYKMNSDLGIACQKVRDWLPDHVAEILYIFSNYGSNYPGPSIESICPFYSDAASTPT